MPGGSGESSDPAMADVVVVGAGPTGLACAAALARHRVPAVVLERGERVGTAWRGRYRALRLNSGRPFSTLPGRRFPRGTPMFPPRDGVPTAADDRPVLPGLRFANFQARPGLLGAAGARARRTAAAVAREVNGHRRGGA